jgi:hypothetical protein
MESVRWFKDEVLSAIKADLLVENPGISAEKITSMMANATDLVANRIEDEWMFVIMQTKNLLTEFLCQEHMDVLVVEKTRAYPKNIRGKRIFPAKTSAMRLIKKILPAGMDFEFKMEVSRDRKEAIVFVYSKDSKDPETHKISKMKICPICYQPVVQSNDNCEYCNLKF